MLPINTRHHFCWIFCAILIAFIYSPSFRGPYILDDSHTLTTNAFVHSYSGFVGIWSTGRAYSSAAANYGYRPVTTTMNMVLWSVADGATWPFHLAKMVLFLLTCWLLYKIWSVLLPRVQPEVLGAAVLVFAVNPVHSQVVTYIAAIATQWAALFVGLAILSYLKFRATNFRRWHLLSLICALLAILSKEEGVVVVALIPLIEIYLRKIEGARLLSLQRVGTLAAYLVPAVIGVGLIAWMFEPTQNLVRSQISMWSYFMTQWRAYVRYFAMYFYSYDLNADNLAFGFSSQFLDRDVLIALAMNIGVVISALACWRRYPALTLAVVWFYVGISPASSVVVLSEPVNDHRAFIGYLGFAIVGILLLEWLHRKNRTVFLIAAFITVCVYSVMTYQRGDVWSSNEKLWSDTVIKNPTSARALNNLGLELIRHNKYSTALDLLQRCSQVQPDYSACHVNRGVAYAQMGRDAEAEESFALAIKYDQGIIASRYNWAKFLSARGQFAKAQVLLAEADKMAIGLNLDVRMELISVIAQQGQLDISKKLYQEAMSTFGPQPRIIVEGRRLGLDR